MATVLTGIAAPAATSRLRVSGLRKTFGSVVALADATFDVAPGEFLTLLGPSGSGKTTLLLAIAGLIEPDAGEIWMDGRQTTYLPPFERGLGMVFQSYALFPHMTVFENVAFALRMRRRGEAEIRAAVTRALETVQLPQIGDRYPRQLSGGQQQRVAFARALVFEPSIVLMDEPLGALDKKLRDQLQIELKRLHQQLGITVVYVTHDQQEALVLSDRICLMREGRIEQIGSPADLYFQPRSAFTADFVGESNLLAGTCAGRDGDVLIVRLTDGTLVRGMAGAAVETGEAVLMMVRPEAIVRLHEDERAENQLGATVRAAVMTGATTTYFLITDGGIELRAEALTRPPAEPSGPGDRWSVGWPTAHAVILREA